MKKYYIDHMRGFSNEFSLVYTTTEKEDQRAIDLGFERITYRQAIQEVIRARHFERYGIQCFASVWIMPLTAQEYNAYYVKINPYTVRCFDPAIDKITHSDVITLY